MPKSKSPGRPKSAEKMEKITLSLPPKMLEELKERSRGSSNPMAYLIRQAIADFLVKTDE